MEIRIPEWAHTIKDEGALTFLAFVHRITDIYGEDDYYSINDEDLIKMCNKRGNGLVEWLRRFKAIEKNIEFGEPFEGVIIFKYKKRQARSAATGRMATRQAYAIYELQDVRQQMVWMYLLGCFNNNLITKDENKVPHWQSNTAGVKWFKLTREASKYIKVADRCDEEN
jgi:hypothetical protein